MNRSPSVNTISAMSEALAMPRRLLEILWDDSPAPPHGNLLARARKGGGPHGRFGPFLGLGALCILFASLLLQLPAPALHGDGLVGMLGVAAVLLALVVELALNPGTIRWVTFFGLAISLGSAAVAAVQPGGAAVIGCYIGVGMSARRLPGPNALVVFIPTVVIVTAMVLLSSDTTVLTALWAGLGFAFTFMIARFARVGEEQHERDRALIEEEKRSMAAQTEAAALAERGRIAREMHDVLAHSLSALAVELEGARLLARKHEAAPALENAIERAHQHATSGLDEARAAIETLRGDDLPGPERLANLAESFAAEQDVDCDLEVTGQPRLLPSELRLAIYRTAQEALTNVRKHAEPSRVEMHLDYDASGTRLEVADHAGRDGDGDAPCPGPLAGAGAGYGVSGMRERAELLGGRLDAGPTDDGFRVELWLPQIGKSSVAA
jgi:signal transduction histidine kinase